MKTCRIKDANTPNADQIRKLKKIMSMIPCEDELYENCEIFKALSDPTRLKILYLLRHGELCVCEIISAIEKPQSTISHHLNVLKNVGFIKWRKNGVWIYYKLNNSKTIEIIDELTDSH